jgi:hypothetical protein
MRAVRDEELLEVARVHARTQQKMRCRCTVVFPGWPTLGLIDFVCAGPCCAVTHLQKQARCPAWAHVSPIAHPELGLNSDVILRAGVVQTGELEAKVGRAHTEMRVTRHGKL